MRNVLSLTAKPILNSDTTSTNFGFLAPTQQQGGGLVDCHAAYHTTTTANISSISFNTTRHQVRSVSFQLSNVADKAVSYSVQHIPAASFLAFTSSNRSILTQPNRFDQPSSIRTSYAELSFDKTNILLPALGSVSVTVSLSSPPQGLDTSQVPIYGGYITFNCTDPSAAPAEACYDLSIPYTGVAGELYGVDVLSDLELIAVDSDGNTIDTVDEGYTFNVTYTNGNISADEFPGFQFNDVFTTQRNIFDLVDHDTGAVILPGDYDGSGIGSANSWSWDGTNGNGTFLPAGKYYWNVRALQLEGAWNEEKEYVSLNTSRFGIAYTSNSTGLPS